MCNINVIPVLSQVDGSIRKLLKSGKDVEDGLIAAVIRNLKIVEVCKFVLLVKKNIVTGYRELIILN